MAEIYGVITFYSRFTLKPKGKYNISVCLGTACFVKGSQKILDRLLERLKIGVGETTADGKFSLEATRCVGACGLAPVFTVNGEVYGKATVQKIREVEVLEKKNENEGIIILFQINKKKGKKIMKTLEEIHKIREEKKKRARTKNKHKCRYKRKTYFSMSWNRMYFIKISTNFRKL